MTYTNEQQIEIIQYPENVMRVARLVCGWYEDVKHGLVKNNMKLMCEIYTADERKTAYKFMVKFQPTFSDLATMAYTDGTLNRSRFFNSIATMLQHTSEVWF